MRINPILLILLMAVPSVSASLIGLEQLPEGYLKAWNQGQISSETYYSVPYGFWQHGNTINRVADITYTYGYGTVSGGIPVVRGTGTIPNVLKNATDNLTYYWIDGAYTQTQGSTVFELHKNMSQNLTGDFVKVTFSFSSDRRVVGNNWFFHGITSWDVGQDGKADLITFAFENGSVETFNTSSLANFTRNVTKLVLDGGVSTYSYVLDFGKNVTLWYNNTGHLNGDILLGEYMGVVEAGRLYNWSYEWVDAVCTLTCSPGATLSVTDYIDFAQIWEGETKSRQCKYSIARFLPGANCSFSADCSMNSQYNITSSTYQVIEQNTGTGGLRCANASACATPLSNLRENIYFNFNLSGYLPPPEPDFKYTSHRCWITGSYYSTPQDVVTNMTKLNVTIWTPPNGTNINNTVNWSVFGCNWSGQAPSFTSLLLNNAINHTQGFIANLSVNVTFDFYSCLNWTCEACKYGHCHKAWNGNYTFCQVLLGGLPSSSNYTTFIPFRKDDFTQLGPEDKTILGILGGILLGGLIVWAFRMKSGRKHEDATAYSREIRK